MQLRVNMMTRNKRRKGKVASKGMTNAIMNRHF